MLHKNTQLSGERTLHADTRNVLMLAMSCLVTTLATAVPSAAAPKLHTQHAAAVVTTSDVSLDFVNADITDVLKALAMQTRTNIVAGKDVVGTVTVSLNHVSLEDALQMITKLSGYTYGKVNQTYIVGPQALVSSLDSEPAAPEASVTSVVPLTYADPTSLSAFIKDRYPDVKANIGSSVGGQGGVLILTGPAKSIDGAKQVVVDTDIALSKNIANQQTRLYKIKYAGADDLQTVLSRLVPSVVVTPGPSQGFSLKAPSTADAGGTTSTTTAFGGSTAGSPTTSATAMIATKPTTYSLLLTGSEADITRALAVLAEVDTRPEQINYAAKIAEIDLNKAASLGLKWDLSGATTRFGELPDNLASGKPTLGDNGYSGKPFKIGMIGRTALSNLATVSLDAMFNSGDAKLLSNPNIAAVDGQQAAVFIGDAIRYISSITQTTTGTTVTTDTVNVGIKLFVTGKVSNDGYVTVNIHPEVSTITGYLTVPGGGSLPQIANREATTTVRVKDGDTLAIGGLISENDIKNVQKIPVLGDLPFLGGLFRDTSRTHRRNEVVIFVKVNIMKDAQ